ncbi:hypothetical protein HY030_01445 [Candidatus Gottesmanbacteria bacterium]|nr:hypothetical protein [Candidatus Gottesmanbacteria bacterium]
MGLKNNAENIDLKPIGVGISPDGHPMIGFSLGGADTTTAQLIGEEIAERTGANELYVTSGNQVIRGTREQAGKSFGFKWNPAMAYETETDKRKRQRFAVADAVGGIEKTKISGQYDYHLVFYLTHKPLFDSGKLTDNLLEAFNQTKQFLVDTFGEEGLEKVADVYLLATTEKK